MPAEKPIEVAIIGGGCASMTAAFELTRAEHNGRYHVTVYQLGWRLGGKGASGRGAGNRIEEHGLHLWMGFYENAFRLMRDCYTEANRDPAICRLADWRDAFVPDHVNVAADRSPGGRWTPWLVHFPALPGLPGDPIQQRWTVADYMVRALLLVRSLLESITVRVGATLSTPPSINSNIDTSPANVTENISRLLRIGQLATLGGVIEAVRLMGTALSAFQQYPENLLLRLQESTANAARRELEKLIAHDDESRRLWEVIDVILAIVRGTIRFRLFTDPRGFDAIDEYDYREWLHLNGAAQSSVNGSFVRAALYDLAFAYEDGDVGNPRSAAGQALRSALRSFFTYRGAFFWKMQAGMGDVVFAPLYETLKRRGVRFEFFHRLTKVRIAEEGAHERPYVTALDFDVQATTPAGGEYQPLFDVGGLPCWPSHPDWTQLADGDELRRERLDFESHWDRRRAGTKTLRVGEDFDLVVLGLGVGCISETCAEIIEREPRWRAMVEHVKSVPTQVFQVWMNDDMKALGWRHGPVNVSGFVEPFDTWADMTHLAREESHARDVGAIAYFCSVLPDAPAAETERSSYPAERHEEVKQNAIRFLNRDIVHLWPSACDPSGFRWETLVGANSSVADSAHGEARFEGQYWRANVNPSDRYTLSLPGSLRYRISPLDHTFDNLTLAGDWTDCGFNHGCVEAAVMSGLLAAHAISRSPPLEQIVGYDHP